MVDAKLREAVLFFLDRAHGRRLGITKLSKLMYYADLLHRRNFGTKLTALDYVKGSHGPEPVGRMDVLEALAREGAIRLRQVRRFQHVQLVVEALRPPDLTVMTFSERAALEETALDWLGATTGQLETAIRLSGPWKETKQRREIAFTNAAVVA